MLMLPSSVRGFIWLTPADMRRSFDGLATMTREIIQEDPLSGHLFAFFNRRKNRVKILFWDRAGLAFYYKRLETGVFRLWEFERSKREASPSRLRRGRLIMTRSTTFDRA